MSNALEELKRFQTDRLLHKQEFDVEVATINILEELFEIHGVRDNKDRQFAKEAYRAMKEQINELYTRKLYGKSMNGFEYNTPTEYDKVDGFCDIQNFAGGEVYKLGYDNELSLLEMAKEVNSRKGEIVNGKFEKYKTEEAKALWYTADYSLCKL